MSKLEFSSVCQYSLHEIEYNFKWTIVTLIFFSQCAANFIFLFVLLLFQIFLVHHLISVSCLEN